MWSAKACWSARSAERAAATPYPQDSDAASLWERGWRLIDEPYGNSPQARDLLPSFPQVRKASPGTGTPGYSLTRHTQMRKNKKVA
jgi:hypothetical protein